MGGDAGEAKGEKKSAHQSARASSTGGQGGQLHLAEALQPGELNRGQSRSGSVLGWPEEARGASSQGTRLRERPRSPRRRRQTQSEASRLPAGTGVERTAASAGCSAGVPKPGLAGRELRALVLLAPVYSSDVRPSRTRAAGELWGAPREDEREATSRGGGLWSFPRPRVRRGAWGATPEVLIVGRASAELLGNRPTLRSAGPGSLQGGCSSQQQQKLGAAWAGH